MRPVGQVVSPSFFPPPRGPKKEEEEEEEEEERGKERQREIKTPGFPAYPYIPPTQFPIQTGVGAPLLLGGMVLVLMRAPVCFEPSL